MDTTPIIVSQVYPVSREVLWRAITDPAKMRQWFFPEIPGFEARVGFSVAFEVIAEGDAYLHPWQVLAAEPQRRLLVDWRYGGIAGQSEVEWRLSDQAGGSALTLTHRGHESFSGDASVFSREAGVNGWRYFLCDSLKGYLDRR